MDYLGNSILQLQGSDPAVLSAIQALEAQQQFASVACIADAGQNVFNGSQPVTQTTVFTGGQIGAFFRRGYAQTGFAVSTNLSQGDYLYALRENNLITGLRWERRGTEPALAKFLITAQTDFELSRITTLTVALQILPRDINQSSFGFTPVYGNLVRYPSNNEPNDVECSHRVMWNETIDIGSDPRIHYIDFKIIGQALAGPDATFEYKTGGYADTYQNFISVKRIQ